MKEGNVSLQIGKRRLISGVIETLKNCFKERENVKLHVLKSAGRNRGKIKEMADKIINELGEKYTYRIVGFTIFIKKWRKKRE